MVLSFWLLFVVWDDGLCAFLTVLVAFHIHVILSFKYSQVHVILHNVIAVWIKIIALEASVKTFIICFRVFWSLHFRRNFLTLGFFHAGKWAIKQLHRCYWGSFKNISLQSTGQCFCSERSEHSGSARTKEINGSSLWHPEIECLP